MTSRAAALALPSCRNHFGDVPPLVRGHEFVFDTPRMLLLPQTDKAQVEHRNHSGHLRVVTYEDWVYSRSDIRLSLSRPMLRTPPDDFIHPLAVSAAQRPVKVIMRLNESQTPFVSPQIWKSASTTLTTLLTAEGAVGPHFCSVAHQRCKNDCSWDPSSFVSWHDPHTVGDSPVYCARQQASPTSTGSSRGCADADIVNPSGACLLHGSFVLRNGGGGHSTDRRSNIRPPFPFAFVRNPLDRFLSTFRPDTATSLPA